jgi:hypothetical protein
MPAQTFAREIGAPRVELLPRVDPADDPRPHLALRRLYLAQHLGPEGARDVTVRAGRVDTRARRSVLAVLAEFGVDEVSHFVAGGRAESLGVGRVQDLVETHGRSHAEDEHHEAANGNAEQPAPARAAPQPRPEATLLDARRRRCFATCPLRHHCRFP